MLSTPPPSPAGAAGAPAMPSPMKVGTAVPVEGSVANEGVAEPAAGPLARARFALLRRAFSGDCVISGGGSGAGAGAPAVACRFKTIPIPSKTACTTRDATIGDNEKKYSHARVNCQHRSAGEQRTQVSAASVCGNTYKEKSRPGPVEQRLLRSVSCIQHRTSTESCADAVPGILLPPQSQYCTVEGGVEETPHPERARRLGHVSPHSLQRIPHGWHESVSESFPIVKNVSYRQSIGESEAFIESGRT